MKQWVNLYCEWSTAGTRLNETAALALNQGDAHLALSKVTQAVTLIDETEYGLRRKGALHLPGRIQLSTDNNITSSQ